MTAMNVIAFTQEAATSRSMWRVCLVPDVPAAFFCLFTLPCSLEPSFSIMGWTKGSRSSTHLCSGRKTSLGWNKQPVGTLGVTEERGSFVLNESSLNTHRPCGFSACPRAPQTHQSAGRPCGSMNTTGIKDTSSLLQGLHAAKAHSLAGIVKTC